MRLTDFLDRARVHYEITEHPASFTAQHLAAAEHESGEYVAKPVIVKAGGMKFMCVLPACCRINLRQLATQLGAESVELATEADLAAMFPDCEIGAEPPFGNLYDMPTIIDKSLAADEHILFQAGTHRQAIRISMADYQRLVQPRVLNYGYHTTN